MMLKALPLLLAFVPCLSSGQTPTPKPPPPVAHADPANVDDDDFKIQGEYVGEREGRRFGVQIIALGEGKFEAVRYLGGLPGDGWNVNREEVIRTNGERSFGSQKAIFQRDDMKGEADGTSIIVTNASNERVVEMNRVKRLSPTLDLQPPAGAIVLFDGKENHFPGSKVTADGLLEQGATSSDKFGDCTLHLEFMLSYMPKARGQGRSNSGVYLQGRYEVQVLDSFGLEGKNNECGGLYTIQSPKLNMCFPPLTWQTYDIDFTAAKYDAEGKKISSARFTVKHNGVIVHDNVEAPHTTTAAPVKEENSPGPLYLQNHGNPVRYRNVWMVTK